jgi:hypothetical protein
VKKLISILLLSLYLVLTTELYQLLKIPVLVEHFMEHKKLNPEMTLEAFLKTHYNHPVKSADYKEDRKLPFIIHSVPLSFVFTINSVFTLEMETRYSKWTDDHKIPVYNDPFYNEGFLNAIWQPPRNS